METKNIKDQAIGSGVLFPFEVTTVDGKSGVYPVTGKVDLIENNITSLMVYPRGFKFRQEEFGNILETYLEEPNTQALAFLIKANISSIIRAYEPRVELSKISTQQYESWIKAQIHFNISGTPLPAYTEVFLNRNI